MPELLNLTRIGNPVLRQECRELTRDEILDDTTQALIRNMKYTLAQQQLGVALAAPQVGEDIALSVIGIKPTPNRPELEKFETVIINPEISEKHGELKPMWEGCVSCGKGDDTLFALVPRYGEITLRWTNEKAQSREELIGGFVAHVVQHEVDHLNGVMFIDRVEDTSSYMMSDEYRKRILKIK